MPLALCHSVACPYEQYARAGNLSLPLATHHHLAFCFGYDKKGMVPFV